jgi:DNA-binding NarL/FixJ family response regulator
MSPIQLLLVDDHRLILNGIRAMLSDVEDIQVIGEATNAQEAIAFVESHEELDVILMDIKMPGKNGIEATREILAFRPGVKVIALTMFEDDEFITNMLHVGATGYVLKHTSKSELVNAIRKVSNGEPYYSHDVAKIVITRFLSQRTSESVHNQPELPVQNTIPDLTDREVQILKLVSAQLTNQEIADKLYISPRTVHSHRRNLMQKLGVKNTAGLVMYATKHGIA